MDRDETLLRFDTAHPVWTRDLLRTEGAAEETIDALISGALLAGENGVLHLTTEGENAFRLLVSECFLESAPGRPAGDAPTQLFRTRLESAFRRSFIQRWGTKEFHPGARLSYIPDSADAAVVAIAGGRPDWPALRSAESRAFAERFPRTGMAARDCFPKVDEVREWILQSRIRVGALETDLLMLCGYDVNHYMHFPPHPNDDLGLKDKDRYFCFRAPGTVTVETLLAATGRMHLALDFLRRAVLPGFVDRDSQDQDNINWLVFASDSEREVERVLSLLAPFGDDLIAPAFPFEIWAVSVEALASVGEPFENVHELFESRGRPVRRMS